MNRQRDEEEYARSSDQKEVKKVKEGHKLTSFLREAFTPRIIRVLALRDFSRRRNDPARLGLQFFQSVGIVFLLAMVSGEEVFRIYEDTKSILFALSCAVIWIGLFSSIQEICKERAILKKEYMEDLKLTDYIVSKILVQMILGMIQSLVMTLLFSMLIGLPPQGILGGGSFSELFITLWLTFCASAATGLLLSAIAKNPDRAMAAAPFVLILQLLFSGILFTLRGEGRWLSRVTVSYWSVQGLGSIASLNILPTRLQLLAPEAAHEAEEIFQATSGHLFETWQMMAFLSLICVLLCFWLLKRVSKEGR